MKLVVFGLTLAALAGMLCGIGCQGQVVENDLLKDLRSDESEVKSAAILQISKQPELLENKEVWTVYSDALLAQDEAIRSAAEIITVQLSDKLIPKLKTLLSSPDNDEFLLGATIVRQIGSKCGEFTDVIAKRLNDSMGLLDETKPDIRKNEFRVRLSALWALEEIGDPTAAYIDDMLKVVKTKFEPGIEFNLQLGAIRVLTRLGPKAKSALPTLIELTKDTNLSVRSAAIKAIGSIGAEGNAELVNLLTSKLDSEMQKEKLAALESLARFGQSADSARAKVRDLMLDNSKNVYPQAAVTYYRITGKTEDMVKVLERSLDNLSYETDAIDLIGGLGDAAGPLLPGLIAKLDSEESSTREYAVLALKRLGPVAKTALEKLQAMAVSESDVIIRQHVAAAIAAIDPQPQ